MITAKKTEHAKVAAAYEKAANFLPMFKDKLLTVPPQVMAKAREIRLRAGQPVAVEYDNKRLFINAAVTAEDLKKLIEMFCDYSLHSFQRQLAQGYITLAGGFRAGFCGTAAVENDCVKSIRDITSINLRIAREFRGCSNLLFNSVPPDSLKSLLIIGKPMSAKTTVLRDFARNLSESGFKVAVIDERGELAAEGFQLGVNTDVLNNFPKKAGFITALRALSPDFIICDEIADDGNEVSRCLNCGVSVIMTAHCGSLEEALCSFVLSEVIGQTNYIALLGAGMNIGKLTGLWRKGGKTYENVFVCGENALTNSTYVRRTGVKR